MLSFVREGPVKGVPTVRGSGPLGDFPPPMASVIITMQSLQRPRSGRSLTLEEHREVFEWNNQGGEDWPRIELALNYPDTPEMFGVIERGEVGPTLFVWVADWGVIIEPFSGGSFVYTSVTAALQALSGWATRALSR